MRWDLRAWRQLWWAWLPVTALLAAAVALLVYLTGTTHGAQADLRERVAALEAEVADLERAEARAKEELRLLEDLNGQLEHLEQDVLGTLEQRVVRVLRAVGDATQAAGLRPERFRYDARTEGRLGLTRFGVAFNVDGTFDQIVRLLEALAASDELLIVDRLELSGETEPRTAALAITVHVSTYVTEASPELLAQLLGRREGGGGGAD